MCTCSEAFLMCTYKVVVRKEKKNPKFNLSGVPSQFFNWACLTLNVHSRNWYHRKNGVGLECVICHVGHSKGNFMERLN